jgi:ABC-type nitrate/sulfonate/bicarbonate transport system substrate-binding protein
MLVVLFVLFLSVFITPLTFAAEKIRMSVSGSYNMIFLAAGVAQHRGFFKDEGLDADIVVMGAAPSIAALSNGDIDFTLLTGTVIRAAIRGLPVRLVAGLMTGSPHVLLARQEIRSVKDLSGKKVGLAGFGDATHVLARIILARNGVDPDKEIQFVPLGSDSGRFAGLQQKLADAVITSPPWDFEGKKIGYNILARAYDYVNYPLSGVGVNVKAKPRAYKENRQSVDQGQPLHPRQPGRSRESLDGLGQGQTGTRLCRLRFYGESDQLRRRHPGRWAKTVNRSGQERCQGDARVGTQRNRRLQHTKRSAEGIGAEVNQFESLS